MMFLVLAFSGNAATVSISKIKYSLGGFERIVNNEQHQLTTWVYRKVRFMGLWCVAHSYRENCFTVLVIHFHLNYHTCIDALAERAKCPIGKKHIELATNREPICSNAKANTHAHTLDTDSEMQFTVDGMCARAQWANRETPNACAFRHIYTTEKKRERTKLATTNLPMIGGG